ncbi:hypothetical protein GCM10029963_05000 [Micromonospora andamanensis]
MRGQSDPQRGTLHRREGHEGLHVRQLPGASGVLAEQVGRLRQAVLRQDRRLGVGLRRRLPQLRAGQRGHPRKCQYKDRDDKQVTVDYVSSRYTLTFYAAKTAEKIGEGGRVNAPAVRCPSFISYNKETMKAYAQPDSGAIELALDKFTS